MKLESLNNPKYSLTPEKMGELVGGRVYGQTTGGDGKTYSADAWVSLTNEDSNRNGNIVSVNATFSVGDDTVNAEKWLNNRIARYSK